MRPDPSAETDSQLSPPHLCGLNGHQPLQPVLTDPSPKRNSCARTY